MPPQPGDTDPRRVRRRIAVSATVGFGGLAALVAVAGASGSAGHAARPTATTSGQSAAAQERDAGPGVTLEQWLRSQGTVPSSGQGYGFGRATKGQAPLVRSGAS